MRPAPRTRLVAPVAVTGAVLALACGGARFILPLYPIDLGRPPQSAANECSNAANFVITPDNSISDVQRTATGATVRIYPRKESHLKDIPSLAKGRIIARFENASNIEVPELELPPGGVSCWRVVKRGKDLAAQYFSSDRSRWRTVPVTIYTTLNRHSAERARFNQAHVPPPEEGEGLGGPSPESPSLADRMFRFADFRPSRPNVLIDNNCATCSMNGWCESPVGAS